ncbi:myeloid leukemia factor 1 isoform X2 [Tachyglossus aculeatus]|uniref:myeloid leukemia factor 1 isoform X2 n=1 Tax=Tachyglossus aculeatus TaxID=9261 RepID=UPI0018F520B6|nr:myeloid leukemia factor 1 isoform X2 [Tachyglossus aculeatus]
MEGTWDGGFRMSLCEPREPFSTHHERVRQMMRSFSDPFGRDSFLSLADRGRARHHKGRDNSEVALRGNHRSTDVQDPFQAMDRMMSNMRSSMQELQRNFGQLSFDSDGHSFSSSSVMTYSKVGDEPPKVFQASTQTRRAPGGIKETRKAMKDSDSGLEKMAVGHHIHDRAHVIKKSKNNKTGEHEVNQEFINLDESDAHTFDEEWQKEILKFKPAGGRNNLATPKHKSVHHGSAVRKEDSDRRVKLGQKSPIEGPRRPKVFVEQLNIKGSPVKSSKK